MIEKNVELFLAKYNLLKPKNNILVAFSGGYDSMCLLHVMKCIAKKYQLNLFAIHLNHNWRGEESDLEEENCKIFCSDIEFYSEKLSSDIPHTETAARKARYDFFEKCAKKFNSEIILTAHNANDNAETVFYRILKGTGITGLEGIKEHRDIYYRPLLNIYRDDIEQYCKKNKLIPNIDSSNFDSSFARNKIRQEIFPKLKEINTHFINNLNKLSKSAAEANKIIETNLMPLENYSAKQFTELANYYQSAIIHNFLRSANIDYDMKKINEIVDFIVRNLNSKSGKTLSLTTNLWLFVNNKKIEVIKKHDICEFKDIKIIKEGSYEIADYKFTITKCNKLPKKFPLDEELIAYVNLHEINFDLRTRKTNDTIQPLGMQGTQPLKKYLSGKKIPKHEKANLIVLCQDNDVLWVPGYGISEKIKVVSFPTHVLKLEKRG